MTATKTAEEIAELRQTAERLLAMKYDQLKAEGEDLHIADWFDLSGKLPERGVNPGVGVHFEVVSESERAVRVRWFFYDSVGSMAEDGAGFEWFAWLPKAAIESLTGYLIKEEMMHNGTWAKPSARYDALVSFAKENGVKGVRAGMRAATILAKVREAGLEYAY